MQAEVNREIPWMFEGRIILATARLAIPILIGSVLQFVLVMADAYFVSRIDPSSTALLSGTGLVFPVFLFIAAVAGTLNVGVSTLIGRAVGERNERVLRHTCSCALSLAVCFALPVVALGYALGEKLIHALAGGGMSEDALHHGLVFFHCLLPGLGVMVVVQVLLGILQGQGLTGSIARAAAFSVIVNLVLDPVLIFGLHMGVAGAGCATTAAALCALASVLFTFRRGKSVVPLQIDLREAKLPIVKEILRIGLPQLVNMVSQPVLFMVFNKLVSSIGQDAMNSWTLASRTDQAIMIPSSAIAGATSILISQNFGRRKLDRVRSVYKGNITLALCVVAISAVIYMVAAPNLFAEFSDVPVVVRGATHQVRLLALTFTGVSVGMVSGAAFQATGRPLPTLVLGIVRIGIMLLPIELALHVFASSVGMSEIYISLGIGNLFVMPVGYLWVRRHLRTLAFRSVDAAAPVALAPAAR